MFKREPQVKILVFPSSTIDRVAGEEADDPFVVQDIFSGYLVQQMAESSEIGDVPPSFNAAHWKRQYAFDFIDKRLDFMRFHKDGKVKRGVPGQAQAEGMGGWTLKPMVKPLNCRLDPAPPNAPHPNNDFDALQWRPVKGTAWEMFVPAEPPHKTYIRHRVQEPNTALEVVSQRRKRATGLEVELIWNGVFAQHKKDPGVRLVLIDKQLSVVWRRREKSNTKPTIERWRNTPEGSGWEVWKRLDDAKPVEFKGRTRVRLQAIAGMWVVDIDDHSYYLADAKTQPGEGGDAPHLQALTMTRDPLRLSVFGVDVTMGVSELEYQPAAFIRRTVRSLPSPNVTEPVTGFAGGRQPPGTTVKVEGVRGRTSVNYTVEIYADHKRENSPFVSSVGIHFPGHVNQQAGAPIDLRPAALSMQLSSGEPGLMATSEVQLELSRSLLDEHLPNWRTWLKPFAPVRVLARWTYDTALTILDDPNIIVPGDWTRVFEGYVATFDQATAGYNDRTLSVVLRDPIMRLKAPAGFVDERYGPLDLLYAQGNGQPLYDGECVKYLLTTELGSRLADTLNGNGDALVFSDPRYPMLSYENDRSGYFTFQRLSQPGTQSGFMLPPPFGRDVFSWIEESIAEPMNAIFFWGYSPYATVDQDDDYAYGTPPLVPVYGNIAFYMAALGAPRDVADAISLDEDANKLFASVSVETLTEKLFNEVVVWGVKPEGTLGSMMVPSLHSGRATLPAGHPNAAAHSWRRVQLQQHDFIGRLAFSDYAEALATLVLLPYYHIEQREVTVVMPRGDETLRWGMLIKPRMQATGSDFEIGVNEKTFRISRLNHNWNFTGENPDRAFVTEMICRPV